MPYEHLQVFKMASPVESTINRIVVSCVIRQTPEILKY